MKSKKMFYAIIFGLLLLTISSSSLFAQEPSAEMFLPDSVFDFGFFATDARVVHTFPIINTGNDTLEIVKIKPSCGCTAAPLSSDKIAPGDTANVYVYFDSKRLKGLVKKNVAILSNDPIRPLRDLAFISITEKKHPYIAAKPEVINFGRLSMDKIDKTYSTTLTNITDTTVQLSIVDYSKDYIDISLEKNSLKPGESGKFFMTLKKIPVDPAFYNFSATLSANIENIKIHLSIPAVGRLNVVE